MEWISVKERTPPWGIRHRFLFLNGKKEVTFGYAHDPKEGWFADEPEEKIRRIWINDMDNQTDEIATHWMPLPQPPTE